MESKIIKSARFSRSIVNTHNYSTRLKVVHFKGEVQSRDLVNRTVQYANVEQHFGKLHISSSVAGNVLDNEE